MENEDTPVPTSTPLVDPPPAPPAEPSAEDGPPDWINDPKAAYDALQKARDEAASYRVKAKTYSETFSTFSPQEEQYLLNLVAGLGGDDDSRSASVSEMKRLIEILGGEEPATEAPASEKEQPSPDETAAAALKPEDVSKLVQSQLAEVERERKINEYKLEIETVAQTNGWAPDSIERNVWLSIAAKNGGDLAAAAERTNAWMEGKIQQFTDEKAGAASRFPKQTGSNGGVPPQANQAEWVGDTKKTREAVAAFIRSRAGEAV